jgi:hypothetical protein
VGGKWSEGNGSYVALIEVKGSTLDSNANEETTEQTVENSPANDFSLSINNAIITLNDWDYEVNLDEVLGDPVSQNVEELGDGADTHTGSFIKRVKYDGLQFELFSPKQNGKDFWIMTMEIFKKGYKTPRGIEIGNTVEAVMNAYPGIEIALDGRTNPNNCAYEISNEEQYNYLRLDVKEGLVSGMKIYHLIN